jgi:hypothetical protein
VTPLSANLFLCEKVLTEPNTGTLTAVNITDTLRTAPSSTVCRFFAMTLIYGYAGDTSQHVLSVRISRFNGEIIHQARDFPFKNAYRNDPKAPGGLHVYTEFVIDVAQLGAVETAYVVWAFVDGEAVAKAPVMLRVA